MYRSKTPGAAGTISPRPNASWTGQLSCQIPVHRGSDDDRSSTWHDVSAFLQHVLPGSTGAAISISRRRLTTTRSTTSGAGLNRGIQLVVAAVARPRRTLPTEPPPAYACPTALPMRACA